MDESQSESRPGTLSGTPLAETWERFRGVLLDRLMVLERVGAELLEEVADEASMREAERTAGDLSGSLRSFGLARGSDLAAEVQALARSGVLHPGDTFRYSGLVVALRDTIEEARPPRERAAGGGSPRQTMGGTPAPSSSWSRMRRGRRRWPPKPWSAAGRRSSRPPWSRDGRGRSR